MPVDAGAGYAEVTMSVIWRRKTVFAGFTKRRSYDNVQTQERD